eukprot:TRINITY_DN13413_c0_g1_i1.p1 TRINITY_DN13413_c0_g1~~TRINITY_DN13413_c0_g1_i1.p1  ORF type:complete len:757 (+),score=118.45 TRINITY_DN13413_c0_g1_i1:1434-3704(+)
MFSSQYEATGVLGGSAELQVQGFNASLATSTIYFSFNYLSKPIMEGSGHVWPLGPSTTKLPKRIRNATEIKSIKYLKYDVKTINHETKHGHFVEVETQNKTWSVERSSSSFKHFYLTLRDLIPSLKIPALHQRSIFSASKSELEKRRGEQYSALLHIISKHPDLYHLAIVLRFLDVPENLFHGPDAHQVSHSSLVYLCVHSGSGITSTNAADRIDCEVRFHGHHKVRRTNPDAPGNPNWFGEYLYFSTKTHLSSETIEIKVQLHQADTHHKVPLGVLSLAPAWFDRETFYDISLPLVMEPPAEHPRFIRIWLHVQDRDAPKHLDGSHHKLHFFRELPAARVTVLNSDHRVFPGQTISAVLKLRYNPNELKQHATGHEIPKFDELGMLVWAENMTTWRQQAAPSDLSDHEHHSGSALLAQTYVSVWKPADKEATLAPGIYSWPVSIKIPDDAPASLDYDWRTYNKGALTYNISIVPHLEGVKMRHVLPTTSFTVLSPVHRDEATKTLTYEKTESCEKFSLTAKMPRGFVFNKKARIIFHLKNEAKKIDTLYVFFLQKQTLRDNNNHAENVFSLMHGVWEVSKLSGEAHVTVTPSDERAFSGSDRVLTYPTQTGGHSPLVQIEHYLVFCTKRPNGLMPLSHLAASSSAVRFPVSLGYKKRDVPLSGSNYWPETMLIHSLGVLEAGVSYSGLDPWGAIGDLEPAPPRDKLSQANIVIAEDPKLVEEMFGESPHVQRKKESKLSEHAFKFGEVSATFAHQ